MPKTSSDDIFTLIKSLSKSEKRYFKLYAARKIKGEFIYIQLFDAIDSQSKYNEQKLLRKLRTINARRFSDFKNYLYKMILNAIVPFGAEKTITSKLTKFLSEVEFLYERSLLPRCEAVLSKAKAIAYKHDKYLPLLEILGWEINTIKAHGITRLSANKLDALIKDKAAVTDKLVNQENYKDIRHSLFKHYVLNGIARSSKEIKAYEKFIKNSALEGADNLFYKEDKALSFDAKADFYYINALYNYAVGDLMKSYSYYKKIADLFKKYPDKIVENPSLYLTALSNYSGASRLLCKHEECLHTIKEMRAIPAKSVSLQIAIFTTSYLAEADIYLNMGEFNKGTALVAAIEKGMEFYKGKIRSEQFILFYLNIAILYFGTGDYSRSLVWLNKILNNSFLNDAQTDINCFSRIMTLLIHFELGNNDLLEYIVKSTYRFLYKRKRLYKFETSILNFIRKKIPKIFTNKERIEAFKELKKEMEKITRDPFEKKALEYFDFTSWVESKIENRPFAEVVRQKARAVL